MTDVGKNWSQSVLDMKFILGLMIKHENQANKAMTHKELIDAITSIESEIRIS